MILLSLMRACVIQQVFSCLFNLLLIVLILCLLSSGLLEVLVCCHCFWVIEFEGFQVDVVWHLDTTGSGKKEVAVEVEVAFEGHAEFVLLGVHVIGGYGNHWLVVLNPHFEILFNWVVAVLTEALVVLVLKHIH